MKQRLGKNKFITFCCLMTVLVLSAIATVSYYFVRAVAEISVDYMENLRDLSYTTVINDESVTVKYRLWIPEDYDENRTYPMITMYHGHGGQGADNLKHLNVFKPLLSRLTTVERQAENPCIILVPQCREDHKWVEVSAWTGHYSVETFDISPDLQATVRLQDEIIKKYSVDTDRQYITGHSMGGLATWDLLSRFPSRYAAALAISGAGNDPESASAIKNVNVWAIHGALDTTVNKEVSEDMVNAILDAGGWAKYTEYQDGGHDIASTVYKDESNLIDFFMSSRKGVKNSYVEERTAAEVSDVDNNDSFRFFNENVAANASTDRDWNGKHYASFDALSVNYPTTNVTSGIKTVGLTLNGTTDMTSDKAIRMRVSTAVSSISNQSLRIDLVGTSTKYMNAGSTKQAYLLENGVATTITIGGSGSGAAVNVVNGASASNTKLTDGYLIIPVSVWGDTAAVGKINIRTNAMYSKNIWNFGDIEYGVYTGGTFTAEKTLWQALNAEGSQGVYTVDSGVDAMLIKANTFSGDTEAVWLKSELNASSDTIDISGYDGMEFYVDNSQGSVKKFFQLYIFSSETDSTKLIPSYGWKTDKGLAYFIPDDDCETFRNAFAFRSSTVPAGFKGKMFIPFGVNADKTNEAGAFTRRENASTLFPTAINKKYLVYFNSVENETFGMKGLGLIADSTEFMKTAFLKTVAVNLASDESESVVVKGVNGKQSQFELWANNKSGVFFSKGNEANEEFLEGSSLGMYIENYYDKPFVLSVKTWNNLGDMTLLGGNIANGEIKLVTATGEVQTLVAKNGYITIPANAKGTLVLPYVGAAEVTESLGGSSDYPLGYPVKHVFRLVFNAYGNEGTVYYSLGKIAVINGDGSLSEIKIDGTGISALAAKSQDGVYKKDRNNIEYSGAVKWFDVSHTENGGAKIEENTTTARVGSEVIFTVSEIADGDKIILAEINGKDVTKELIYRDGKYLYKTTIKENLAFSVKLYSELNDCEVSATFKGKGKVEIDKKVVKEGETVTVTVTADSYYELKSVTVNGETVSITDGKLFLTVTENTVIEVEFSPVEFTIEYVLDGGENDSENPSSYNIESEDIVLKNPTKTGYRFTGWYDAEAGGNSVTVISKGSTGNVVLYARYEKEPSLPEVLPTDFYYAGASIRLNKLTDGGAIRFTFMLSKEKKEEFDLLNAMYGAVVIPTRLKGGELTVETEKVSVADISASFEETTVDGKQFFVARVTLYKIPESNYSDEISARAFIKVGDDYIYTEEKDGRSFSSVAQNLYNDENTEADVKEMLLTFLPKLTFVPGEGTGETKSVVLTNGTTYTFTECEFVAPEGKTFLGYKVGDTVYKAGDTITVSGNVEVVAIWG